MFSYKLGAAPLLIQEKSWDFDQILTSCLPGPSALLYPCAMHTVTSLELFIKTSAE